jgi:HAD superfamily hydrolase (TIGR01509 family)
MSFKAILFDIDGTLVDSNEQHISAWFDTFRSANRDIDRAAIHDQVGKGGDNLVPSLIPGVAPDELDRLGQSEGDTFRDRYRAQVKPFPGARDLVRRVRDDGKKVVLASSGSRAEVDYWTDLLGIRELLTATTSRDDVEHSKPAPDIFRAALDKVTPVQPWEALVIGDTPYDLLAASKNAIASIAVRSGGFSDKVLAAHHPLKIYDDVASILADYDNSPLAA